MAIDHIPFIRQRLIVLIFRFVDHYVTSPSREAEGNAQQLFQSLTQGFPPLGRHEKCHKPAATGAQKFPSQCSCAEPGFIDLVERRVGDFLRQGSLDFPALVQQAGQTRSVGGLDW